MSWLLGGYWAQTHGVKAKVVKDAERCRKLDQFERNASLRANVNNVKDRKEGETRLGSYALSSDYPNKSTCDRICIALYTSAYISPCVDTKSSPPEDCNPAVRQSVRHKRSSLALVQLTYLHPEEGEGVETRPKEWRQRAVNGADPHQRLHAHRIARVLESITTPIVFLLEVFNRESGARA